MIHGWDTVRPNNIRNRVNKSDAGASSGELSPPLSSFSVTKRTTVYQPLDDSKKKNSIQE